MVYVVPYYRPTAAFFLNRTYGTGCLQLVNLEKTSPPKNENSKRKIISWLILLSHLIVWYRLRFSTGLQPQSTAGNRNYAEKTAKEHWPQSQRKPSARQPQPSADKNICWTDRTATWTASPEPMLPLSLQSAKSPLRFVSAKNRNDISVVWHSGNR